MNDNVVDLLKIIASKGSGDKDKSKKCNRYKDKMVIKSKENTFPDIPKDITVESISEWHYSVQSVLQFSPWTISGTSILEMKDLEDPTTPF